MKFTPWLRKSNARYEIDNLVGLSIFGIFRFSIFNPIKEEKSKMSFQCLTITSSCPVWDISACTEVCPGFTRNGVEVCAGAPNTDPCLVCDDLSLCLFAGDALEYNTVVTANEIGGKKVYIGGSVIFNNGPTKQVFDFKSATLIDDFTSEPIPVSVNPPSIDFTDGNPQSALVTFVAEVDPTTYNGTNPTIFLTVKYEYSVEGFTEIIQRSYSGLADINNPACPCADDDFALATVTGEGDSKAYVNLVNDPPNVVLSGQPGDGEYGAVISKTLPVGSTDEAGVTSCIGSSSEESTYAIVSTTPDPVDCGTRFCPQEDSINVTANCVLPTVEYEVVNREFVTDSWCACKEGKIIRPCSELPLCVWSQGYWSTYGVNFKGCADCSKAGTDPLLLDSDFPGITLGGVTLLQEEICLLLQNNPSQITCDQVSCDNDNKKNNNLRSMIRHLIAIKLSALKYSVDRYNDCTKLTLAISAADTLLEGLVINLLNANFTNPLEPNNLFCTELTPYLPAIVEPYTLEHLIDIFENFIDKAGTDTCPSKNCDKDDPMNSEPEECTASCNHDIIKYVVSLDNTVVRDECSFITVTPSLPQDSCKPEYAKTFTVTIYRRLGDTPNPQTDTVVVFGTFTVDGDTTDIPSFNLDYTFDAADAGKLYGVLSWPIGTYDLSTCSFNANGVATASGAPQDITVESKAPVYLTTTILTDALDNGSLLGDCDANNDCLDYVNQNTSLVFAKEDDTSVSFAYCPTSSLLETFLFDLINGGANLTAFIEAYNDANPGQDLSDYPFVTLTYFVKPDTSTTSVPLKVCNLFTLTSNTVTNPCDETRNVPCVTSTNKVCFYCPPVTNGETDPTNPGGEGPGIPPSTISAPINGTTQLSRQRNNRQARAERSRATVVTKAPVEITKSNATVVAKAPVQITKPKTTVVAKAPVQITKPNAAVVISKAPTSAVVNRAVRTPIRARTPAVVSKSEADSAKPGCKSCAEKAAAKK